MSGFFRKKKVQKALAKAREMEKRQPMPKEEVVRIYKEGISFGEKIKSFLKPSWFVADPKSKYKVKCAVLDKSKKTRLKKKKTTVRKRKTKTKIAKKSTKKLKSKNKKKK